ncbi:class A beta-lactamase, subclass A2 [Brucepastera parasyntrophica]|uniref:class A beta-lactamase, subclass A2 n=1 Tax=Brucepastera parasyntrophica TaxID=2880008 RepID=UPI00210D89F7|nr:class A beta-lactamase, subclass A2 [Brucepastera parasyntrophica]ULQ61004.1 class A beta-lactamase, subclass A2 [Brucepastera parasyntrophica]
MKTKFTMYILLLLITSSVFAQTENLQKNIEQILSGKKATVGIAIYGEESKDILNINGNAHFPMQSVFKFHIALAVLNEVDKGNLKLNQKIFIPKEQLLPDTWSPIRDKYPNGNCKVKLSEIIKYTVADSDNNGCDILLRLIGGTKTVNDYIHSIGVSDVAIQVNEEEMHLDWDAQFKNWTTPLAAIGLLEIFYSGKLLTKESYNFLWTIMAETSTGGNRIKGQLPKGTVVAHKTGTSGTSKDGVTAAINDIGIVVLPNGKHFTISVFVSDSKENNAVNEKIISDVSKLAWDYCVQREK